MPLVVPALRLFMVFMNVYDTYKSLKIPPGRKGGLPSVRAMTQRKRDLKGCLAVWVVWVRHRQYVTRSLLAYSCCRAVVLSCSI
jgi:receptor expression-enhancing protein 5/6